jgi:hypothetical protein
MNLVKSSLATSQQVDDITQSLGDLGLISDDGEGDVLRNDVFSQLLDTAGGLRAVYVSLLLTQHKTCC